MPTSHGISMRVIAECDRMGFPETLLPEVPRDEIEDEESISRNGVSSLKGAELSGIEHRPKVSAAVPIKEGVRFAIKYGVAPPYSPNIYFYFKLFMNNRHLISWGIDPNKKPRGVINRALFEPNECDWQFHDCPPGAIAARPFLFSLKQSNNIMKDGGVIDVRVYRSNGRFRCTPVLETHRPQEAYGLLLPGGNLVRNPSCLRFYKWKLIDAINEPYVIFRFNYHTRNFLATVGIIEETTSTDLLQPSRSNYFLEGLATVKRPQHKEIVEFDDGHEPDDDSEDTGVPEPPNQQEEAELSLLIEQSPPIHSTNRNVSKVSSRIANEAKDDLVAHRRPSTPWQDPNNTASVGGYTVDGQKYSQRIRGIRGGAMGEPPTLAYDNHVEPDTSDGCTEAQWRTPQNIPPRTSSLTYRVRRLSKQSRADSISPSLRSWADRDEPLSDSETIIHTAQVVQMQQVTARIVTIENPGSRAHCDDDAVVHTSSLHKAMQNSMHAEVDTQVAKARCATSPEQPGSALSAEEMFAPVAQPNFVPIVQKVAQPVNQPVVENFALPHAPKKIPNFSQRLSTKMKDLVTQMKGWSGENIPSSRSYGKHSSYRARITTLSGELHSNQGGIENLTPESSVEQECKGG